MLDRVVLGCGNFGGIGSAPELFGQGASDDEAAAIMDAAWELGIRWFDTADAYGGGRSESAIGKWIRATGNEPRITTKTFNPMDAGADSGLAPERVRRQLETSLERLAVDSVDLYLAHGPDPDVPVAETFGAFEELTAARKIGAYGVSNFGAAQLQEAVEAGQPRVLQGSYSLLDRDVEHEILPLCAQHGVEFQAFSPLAGGWLTGKYRRDAEPPAGSRMTLRPEPYAGFRDERVYAALDAFAERARERGTSSPALALAWLLSTPQVTSIVVGPSRPEHLEPVREALELRLDEAERDELASLFP